MSKQITGGYPMKTTEPIRNKQDVNALLNYYLKRGELRNHLLITLCIHTALRISDILRLTWDDVYDFEAKRIRRSITIVEKKTGKSKIIALHKNTIRALVLYQRKNAKPGKPLIINERIGKAISRIQAHRLICAAGKALALHHKTSCHSLRKTFGYHSWKSGVSPAIIMEIYNHSSLAVTRRYLGVTQDDKNAVYLNMDFID